MSTTSSNHSIRMGGQGRIVVPAALRAELGFDEGVQLIARIEDGELCIATFRANLERIRNLVREHVPADRDLVAELVAERRREAAQEDAE
jgi:bifunctional DNA-binding transcriptional regulator/antitoxin component of YhaV-PrlF toxin-antitoxin module